MKQIVEGAWIEFEFNKPLGLMELSFSDASLASFFKGCFVKFAPGETLKIHLPPLIIEVDDPEKALDKLAAIEITELARLTAKYVVDPQ
jgi:hypothetical protein